MDPFEKKVIEKAVLVGLNAAIFSKEDNATEETLDELEALLETAGGQCVAKVLQNRAAPDPHSFIGEGKVEEVKELLQTTEATLVVFDNDLSPFSAAGVGADDRRHGHGPQRPDSGYLCPASQDKRRSSSGGTGPV